jgi:diguanylate cyclase (GGDEF)-like protein/PAS domain S-box-containing protein
VRAFVILALGLITVSRLVGFAASEDADLRADQRQLELMRQIQSDDQDLHLALVTQDVALQSYLSSANPEKLADYNRAAQTSDLMLSRLGAEIPDGALRQAFAQVQTAAGSWRSWAERQRGAVPTRQGPLPAGEADSGSRLMAGYETADGRFNQAAQGTVSELSARATSRQRYDFMAIIACAAVVAAALLLLSYLVILAVVKPISRLAGQARQLTADSAMPIEESRRRDEIGDLERAINGYRYAMSERLAMAQLVAEQDARFRLVFDRVPLGLCRLSLEGDFLESNPALLSLLGYPAERFTELNIHQITHEDDVERNRGLLAGAADGSAAAQLSLEIRLLAADGDYVWCELHGSAVRDGDGRPLYFVVLIEDISQRKGQELLLVHQVEHDALTGLHNRSIFFQRLERLLAARTDQPFSICVVDLDGFKQVNDSDGRQFGDRLIKLVAGSVRQKLRVADTVARLGDDQFVALLPGTDEAGALAVVRKLLAAFAPAFEIDGRSVHVSASAGVAVHPTDGATAAELMRSADRAMFEAKKAGGSRAVTLRVTRGGLTAG